MQEATMRVYISGPITGHENYMQNFRDAEEYLIEQGHIPFNPAAVNSQMPESTTYEEYMQIAMTMLSMCDAIYLLEGWEQSEVARRLGCSQSRVSKIHGNAISKLRRAGGFGLCR